MSQLATKADLKEAVDSLKSEVAELRAEVSGSLRESIKIFERDLTINFVVMMIVAALFAYAVLS